jgi:hypothetical protein
LVHNAARINGTVNIITGNVTNLRYRSSFTYENSDSVTVTVTTVIPIGVQEIERERHPAKYNLDSRGNMG